MRLDRVRSDDEPQVVLEAAQLRPGRTRRGIVHVFATASGVKLRRGVSVCGRRSARSVVEWQDRFLGLAWPYWELSPPERACFDCRSTTWLPSFRTAMNSSRLSTSGAERQERAVAPARGVRQRVLSRGMAVGVAAGVVAVAAGCVALVVWAWSYGGERDMEAQRVDVPGAGTVGLDRDGYTVYVSSPGGDRCGRADEGCPDAPEVGDVTLRAQGSESEPPVDLDDYRGDDPAGLYTFGIDEPGDYTLAGSGGPGVLTVDDNDNRNPLLVAFAVIVVLAAGIIGYFGGLAVLVVVGMILSWIGSSILGGMQSLIVGWQAHRYRRRTNRTTSTPTGSTSAASTDGSHRS